MALPSPTTTGRLLLLLKSISDSETSSSKRAKKKSSYKVGSMVEAEVISVSDDFVYNLLLFFNCIELPWALVFFFFFCCICYIFINKHTISFWLLCTHLLLSSPAITIQITEIKPLELRLKFGIGFHGRVHITEVHLMNSLI